MVYNDEIPSCGNEDVWKLAATGISFERDSRAGRLKDVPVCYEIGCAKFDMSIYALLSGHTGSRGTI